tara:strand:+ start:909 stop:2000 length:1092 start_codon:yes stop_codon:yes gene_type:complete
MNINKTLPSRYYLDPDIYEKEKLKILYCTWQYAGHASQVANIGDYLTLKIGDENLIIIRTEEGKLKGFFNVCRHRAHRLLEDNGNVNSITCSYHAWNYSIDGELRYAKNADKMKDFNSSDYCLTRFQVTEMCNFIFVNLDHNAPPLDHQADDFVKDLRKRVSFLDRLKPLPDDKERPSVINANWKIVVDNYLECYHCTKSHPAFVNLIDMDHYQTDVYDIWSRQYAPKSRPDNSAYNFDKSSAIQDMCFWFLWPNTALGYVPGVEALFFSSIRPDSIDKTTRFGHWLVTDDTIFPEGFNEYMNKVLFSEDISICESVQQGIGSISYSRGPLMIDPKRSGISEIAVRHFHGLVEHALADDLENK